MYVLPIEIRDLITEYLNTIDIISYTTARSELIDHMNTHKQLMLIINNHKDPSLLFKKVIKLNKFNTAKLLLSDNRVKL